MENNGHRTNFIKITPLPNFVGISRENLWPAKAGTNNKNSEICILKE